jgi:hypothetical protein
MEAHFYQMALMQICWSFHGIDTRMESFSPSAALTNGM